MSEKIAVYAEGCMYPASATVQPVSTTIAQLQTSGFNTLILSLFHIAAGGDLSFNNTPIISGGAYVGDPSWPALVAQAQQGDVETVCASIGGGGVSDFANLAKIYEANGNSFANTNLQASFAAFRATFPAVAIIDMDCEDTYDPPSFVAFCQMLATMSFAITFCPYTNSGFWVAALQAVEATNPGAVHWWNLQCYDGGYGNRFDFAEWSVAIEQALPGFDTQGFIVAGDWSNDTPAVVTTLLQSLAANPSLGGGFLWTLDQILSPSGAMAAYGVAIGAGLQTAVEKRRA